MIEPELLVFAALCAIGAIVGTALKSRTNDNKPASLNGILIAAAAGIVVGLIGTALHISTSFLLGISIVVGYAGGKKFLDYIVRTAAKKGEDADLKTLIDLFTHGHEHDKEDH